MSIIKAGDKVVFSKEAIKQWSEPDNNWWKYYPFTLQSSFIVQKIHFDGMVYLYLPDAQAKQYNFYVTDIELAEPRQPHDDILEKIKYLNKRFLERKHAPV
jgi:hypothetical protein